MGRAATTLASASYEAVLEDGRAAITNTLGMCALCDCGGTSCGSEACASAMCFLLLLAETSQSVEPETLNSHSAAADAHCS
jgi:hypothetical protein